MSSPYIFIVGTGRCGTHFMYELFHTDQLVDAHHILDADADSFFRYCKWNGLPVDAAPLFQKRALGNRQYYAEANPYLSFHTQELYEAFHAKLILLVRNPVDTVNSHIVKGWYNNALNYKNKNQAIGFQYGMRTNHFFGRIIPKYQEFERWEALSRVGKIAWMWNRVNAWILKDFEKIPKTHKKIVKLEDLDYKAFLDIYQWLGWAAPPTEKHFKSIRKTRPGRQKAKIRAEAWTSIEKEEFAQEVAPMAKHFSYPI